MADRLAALKAAPASSEPLPAPAAAPEATAVPVQEDPLERGFKLVDTIQQKIQLLQSKTTDVKMRGEDVQRSLDAKSDGTMNSLQSAMDDATKVSQSIKKDLDKLKANITELKKNPDGQVDDAAAAGNADVIRIQENQLQHQTSTFVQVMNEYNEVVRNNEKAIIDQVKARMKIKYTTDKGCTMTDAQLTELAQDFVDLEQESPRLTTAKQKLGEIMENRQDYIKMARSMRELQQLYQDLAALLSEQSVLMDAINTNLVTANTYVEDGRKKLNDAKGYAKKNRKCMLWAFVLIGIIFFFVLAVVLGFTV